jgi:molybdenum cofactor cytidylyltransferase
LNIDQNIARKAERMALVVLAAGRSSRFGAAKLLAPLNGRPVIEHVALAAAGIPFAYRLCVTTQGGADLSRFGFDMIHLEQGLAQSASLAAAIGEAGRRNAQAAMILLGDMPLVPQDHLAALVAAFDGDLVASSKGSGPMPPAIIGQRHFASVATLQGDKGARGLIAAAPLVATDAGNLIDIDTPEDLAVAQAIVGRAKG